MPRAEAQDRSSHLEIMTHGQLEALEAEIDVDRAWLEFQRDYLHGDKGTGVPAPLRGSRRKSAGKPNRRRGAKLLIPAAAVVALVIFSMPKAQGFTDIWDMFVEWTGEVFSFANRYEESELAEENIQIERPGTYASLQEALNANGVTIPLAPTWVPEGYEAFDTVVEIDEDSKKTIVRGAFQNDEKQIITIVIIQSKTVDTQVSERDKTEVEIYAINNIDHYLFENNGRVVASWNIENYEVLISGTILRDEMKAMIKSVYERVE